MVIRKLSPLLLTLVLASPTGCDREDVNSAADQADQSTRAAGERIREQAGPALEQAKEQARPTLKRAQEQGRQIAKRTERNVKAGGLTLRVKTAMAASTQLDVSGIDVDTKDQTVILKGTVPDERQKALAEEITKNTAGTRVTVSNLLQVKPLQRDTTP